jgi:hypothetical protein
LQQVYFFACKVSLSIIFIKANKALYLLASKKNKFIFAKVAKKKISYSPF